jgi:hypothetical protein
MTQTLTVRFSAFTLAAVLVLASFVTTVSVPLASGGFA